MWPRDAIATGWVVHHRRAPREHRFRYPMRQVLVDVERLDDWVGRSRLWSLDRGNLATLRRRDHLPDEPGTLAEAARGLVSGATGEMPDGRVLLLSHPRLWGHAFNPVSFLFCLDADDGLAAVIAEVHNTPWDERHVYVLPVARHARFDNEWHFGFDKAFHVSPFLPMDLAYHWTFSLKDQQLDIRMRAERGGAPVFGAAQRVRFEPATPAALTAMPLRFPFLGISVLARIYWQALRLKLKRTPFFTHPAARPGTEQRHDSA